MATKQFADAVTEFVRKAVIKELEQLKKAGAYPAKTVNGAIKRANTNVLEDFDGVSIGEIAEMLIELEELS